MYILFQRPCCRQKELYPESMKFWFVLESCFEMLSVWTMSIGHSGNCMYVHVQCSWNSPKCDGASKNWLKWFGTALGAPIPRRQFWYCSLLAAIPLGSRAQRWVPLRISFQPAGVNLAQVLASELYKGLIGRIHKFHTVSLPLQGFQHECKTHSIWRRAWT